MGNRLLKTPVLEYTPAVPGSPEIPPYCRTITELVPNISSTIGLSFGASGGRGTNVGTSLDITQDWVSFVTGQYTEIKRRVCTAAKPPVATIPARIRYDQRPGWNSGGRSISSISGDGYVEFEVGPQVVGVFAGMATTDSTQLPSEIEHGFYAHRGELDIYERGRFVLSLAVDLSARPRLRVMRNSGVVSYLVNGEWRYSSATQSRGRVHLDASLYTASDYVDNPVIAGIERVAGVMSVGVRPLFSERLRGSIAVAARYVGELTADATKPVAGRMRIGLQPTGDAQMLHMVSGTLQIAPKLQARPASNGGYVRVRATVLGSDVPRSGGRVRVGGWSVSGLGGFPEPATGGGGVVVPVRSVRGMALRGVIGGGDISYRGHAAKGADGPYGGGTLEAGRYVVFGASSAFAPDVVTMVETLVLADTVLADGGPVATFQTVLQLATGVTASLVGTATLIDALLLATTVDAIQNLEALFSERLVLSTQADPAKTATLQYAVNAATGAFTCYNGFDFIGFATLPGVVYGVKRNGIYRIGKGRGDDGQPIGAVLDIGQQDFGTANAKRIESLYLSATTDGEIYAKLRADDGLELTYKVIDHGTNMRAKLAKGAVGRQWRLRLELVDVTEVELDGLELVVGTSSRRLVR